MMKFDLKSLSFDSGPISVDNIFKPICVLGTIDIGGLVVFFALAKLCPVWAAITEVGLLVAFNIAAFLVYWYFAKKDPDRLQSEKYQIQKTKLELETQKIEKKPLLTSGNPDLALRYDSPEAVVADFEEVEDK